MKLISNLKDLIDASIVDILLNADELCIYTSEGELAVFEVMSNEIRLKNTTMMSVQDAIEYGITEL